MLEYGVSDEASLSDVTLDATLKMQTEATGAAYALYWKQTADAAVVLGSYVRRISTLTSSPNPSPNPDPNPNPHSHSHPHPHPHLNHHPHSHHHYHHHPPPPYPSHPTPHQQIRCP